MSNLDKKERSIFTAWILKETLATKLVQKVGMIFQFWFEFESSGKMGGNLKLFGNGFWPPYPDFELFRMEALISISNPTNALTISIAPQKQHFYFIVAEKVFKGSGHCFCIGICSTLQLACLLNGISSFCSSNCKYNPFTINSKLSIVVCATTLSIG